MTAISNNNSYEKLWQAEISRRSESGLPALFFIVLLTFSGGILYGISRSMPERILSFLPVYLFPSVIIGLLILFKSRLFHHTFLYRLLTTMSLFASAAWGASMADERFLFFAIMVNMPLFISYGMSGLKDAAQSWLLFVFAIAVNVLFFAVFSPFPLTAALGTWLMILPIGLISVVLSISRYNLTKKNFITTLQLQNSNDEIRVAHSHLNEKHRELEIKNREITDSINYAKYLQQAILPPLKEFSRLLPGAFILYKPKDIVSGDFYWLETADDLVLVAAADCTGHGIPGAMVSVVCSNSLNRAVKEFGITDPGKILDKVRELVLDTYSKSENEIMDGMDISLAALNTTTRELKWAGANNALWYFQQGVMQKIQADKQPIGKSENPVPFTTHTIHLNEGDSFFLITDGYSDQFGGPFGKKFTKKQLMELLAQNAPESPGTQLGILNDVFEKWTGQMEQVDDICIVGIKV